MQNALRPIQPGASHTLIVSFAPHRGALVRVDLDSMYHNVNYNSSIMLCLTVPRGSGDTLCQLLLVCDLERSWSQPRSHALSSGRRNGHGSCHYWGIQGGNFQGQTAICLLWMFLRMHMYQLLTCQSLLPVQIVNTSTLSVQYSIKLDSQSMLRHAKAQGLPAFVNDQENSKSLVGM